MRAANYLITTKNKMQKKYFKYILKTIGIIVFIYILTKLDRKKILGVCSNINIYWFLISLIFFPILNFIKSIRWKKILFSNCSTDLPLFLLFRMYMSSFFWGVITPGRVGEFTRIFYLKDYDVDTVQSAFSVLYDRILDVIFLFSVGVISFIFFFKINKFVLVILVILVIISFKLIKIKYVLNTVQYFADKLSKSKNLDLSNITRYITSINFSNFITAIFLTAMSWSFYFIQTFFMAKALNIDLNLLLSICCVSISSLIAMLPLSVSGIGTRDAAMIFLFKRINLASEKAVLFSFSILLIMYVNSVISLVFWFKNPGKK